VTKDQKRHYTAFLLFPDPAAAVCRDYALPAPSWAEAVALAAERAELTPEQTATLDRDGELTLYRVDEDLPYCQIEICACTLPDEGEDCQLSDHPVDEEPRLTPIIPPDRVRWDEAPPLSRWHEEDEKI
jgi:hypothetical protein